MDTKVGNNFAVVNLGAFSELAQFTFKATTVPLTVQGKVFLKERLNLSSTEISFNTLPPGKSLSFYHTHCLNEEIYIFIQGEGEFQVDDAVFSVTEGTVVKVDCEGERCWRNTSPAENLYCIVIQARAGSVLDPDIQDGRKVGRVVSWEGKNRI
ncbi:cupin domain-containing protein [Myxacorys almedinensis]|uniref:Cupin domain-containing protein n=1 Tax=Myxacorys almedinensis A TaxID=2690445 RepID=A0A8J7Z3P3_9CYAN|nr:cupin domain-containing protein [Myxacorys almedinensis]NDJ17611.1 cupin domain-containing protein [Myxacorys almedinensis A]